MDETTNPNPTLGQPTGRESSLSSWAGPYVTDMLGRGQALAQTPYEAYTGPLTAGFTGAQESAFSGIAGLTIPDSIGQAAQTAGNVASAAGGMGYTAFTPTNQYQAPQGYTAGNITSQYQAPQGYTAGNITTGAFGAPAAQQYMNPYLQAALEPQLAEARRQAEIARVNQAGRLTRAGAFGGGRQAIMESELTRNMLRNLADITGEGYAQAYDRAQQAFTQDQARALQAQQLQEQARQAQGAQALTGAAQRAQFGQSAQQLREAARQAQGAQALTGAAQRAQYGQAAQQLGEQSRQFGAEFGLDALARQLQAAQAQGQLGQMGLQGQLNLLGAQAQLGGMERDINQEAIDAAREQFEEERLFPYRQIQFEQSLLQGLPLAAQNITYQQPSYLAQLLGGQADLMELLGPLGDIFSRDEDAGGATPPIAPGTPNPDVISA